jgi:hypothetical protein
MSYPRVAFEILVPCNGDELAANIAHALSLGLPEFDDAPLKTLSVIANGPSATLYDFDAPGPTLALNGALKLFTDRGKAPTYWACCDPQALVADFLTDPPMSTIYLVASKCHPLVFQMLQGRDVRLWHIDDHPMVKEGHRAVSVASSVTLCAMTLMSRFGFRHFETYGWDACFYGTEHHAGQHVCDYPENTVSVSVGATQVTIPPSRSPTPLESLLSKVALAINRFAVWLSNLKPIPQPTQSFEGGREFLTTSTWAAEAQDATIQLHYADTTVNINGDGMVKAIIGSK